MTVKKSFIRLSKDGWEKRHRERFEKMGKMAEQKIFFEAKKVF
jgi:hypothetical protein